LLRSSGMFGTSHRRKALDALKAYRDSLAIRESLAAIDRGNRVVSLWPVTSLVRIEATLADSTHDHPTLDVIRMAGSRRFEPVIRAVRLGLIKPDQRAHRAVEYHCASAQAGKPLVRFRRQTNPLRTVFLRMRAADVSQLPVVDGDRIVGLVDESDMKAFL
jgi:CBS domain-containing protein